MRGERKRQEERGQERRGEPCAFIAPLTTSDLHSALMSCFHGAAVSHVFASLLKRCREEEKCERSYGRKKRGGNKAKTHAAPFPPAFSSASLHPSTRSVALAVQHLVVHLPLTWRAKVVLSTPSVTFWTWTALHVFHIPGCSAIGCIGPSPVALQTP